jgi:methionyl-tRNA formyltransferase
LKIIFLGFGKIGFLCLSELIKQHFNIIGVVPRASDLGCSEDTHSVRKLAIKSSIPLYSNDDIQFLTKSDKHRDIDYLISVQYDRILKKDWIELPQRDALNLHFSLLPKLRGCYPTKWAIIEETCTGVTFHSIDHGIDTGDIIDQVRVPISASETDQSLYAKLNDEAFTLFKRNIQFLKQGIIPNRLIQTQSDSSYHPKELPFKGILDCAWSLDFCERFLRAFYFPPYPPALLRVKGNNIGLSIPVKTCSSKSTSCGKVEIIDKSLLSLECSDGILYFDQIWVNNRFISISEASKLLPKFLNND